MLQLVHPYRTFAEPAVFPAARAGKYGASFSIAASTVSPYFARSASTFPCSTN
jgi:hypothetical protein